MRRPLDFYETPEHYVRELLKRVPVGGVVFEPCVGDGGISRFFPTAHTNDIDEARDADYHFDAAQPWPFSQPFDWIITNPPFGQALPILEQCLVVPDQKVALLLRISFFEPTKAREAFLREHPPSGLIYLPRYSFTRNGKSDMATVVWGIWNYAMSPAIQIAERFAA